MTKMYDEILTTQDIEILKKIKNRNITQIRNLKTTMSYNKERIDHMPRGNNPFDLRPNKRIKSTWGE